MGRTRELEVFYRRAVGLHYAFNLIDVGVLFVTIEWETVVNFTIGVEGRHGTLSSEAINWH
jgi:hypothetical protein